MDPDQPEAGWSSEQFDIDDLGDLNPFEGSPVASLAGSLSIESLLENLPNISGQLLEGPVVSLPASRPFSAAQRTNRTQEPRLRSQSLSAEFTAGEGTVRGGQKARERNKRAQQTFRQRQKVRRHLPVHTRQLLA